MRLIDLDKVIRRNKFPQFVVQSVLLMALAAATVIGTAQQRKASQVVPDIQHVADETAGTISGSVASGKAKATAKEVDALSEEVKKDVPTAQLKQSDGSQEAAAQADAAAQTAEAAAQIAAQIAASEAQIQPGAYPIMGLSSITVDQMARYFEENESYYPSEALGAGGAPDIQTFCQIYYDEAMAEGVRPEIPFVQTMKETGWLQYGGDSTIEQFNFAGLGTTGGGVQGVYFPDVRTGVRAQIQHLKAYATDEALIQECVDERYDLVSKGCAPYVEWLGQQENPGGYGWATGAEYGTSIVDMINNMRSF
ncbi:MAG: glucosaminidase domain-containing protein [Hespellia sp.]|nr:glucosaminidase domain-containing protein [Hespellia sp.]